VHFIGIGGYGMSAIARVMLEKGYKVSGSDVARQERTDKLAAQGARIYIGHKPEHVAGAQLVVYSTAIAQDDVERKAAEARNIPVIHRSQMLARLLNAGKGVAVAGAHGKTTTSSMIALVMESCGVDPTYIIGGEIVGLDTNAKAGGGEYVVAEADESDGSFLQYQPHTAVVTNIEPDHLENYDGDFGKLKEAYVQFLRQVKPDGLAVVCADDPNIRELMPRLGGVRIITYSIEPGREADYGATDLAPGDRKVSFTVLRRGERLGRVELSVPGRHNAGNALAAIAVCLEAGLAFDRVAEAIRLFRGAKRRFQVIVETGGILVIDDYAHHPTEIQATIAAAKATEKRIIAVFQPQRYTRTFFLRRLQPFVRGSRRSRHHRHLFARGRESDRRRHLEAAGRTDREEQQSEHGLPADERRRARLAARAGETGRPRPDDGSRRHLEDGRAVGEGTERQIRGKRLTACGQPSDGPRSGGSADGFFSCGRE